VLRVCGVERDREIEMWVMKCECVLRECYHGYIWMDVADPPFTSSGVSMVVLYFLFHVCHFSEHPFP